MKYVLIFLFLPFFAFSQEWHSVNDTLKYPPHPYGETAFGWINHYDTIPIIYSRPSHKCLCAQDTTAYFGWKVVYVYKGYYTDDEFTLGKVWQWDFKPAFAYRYSFIIKE